MIPNFNFKLYTPSKVRFDIGASEHGVDRQKAPLTSNYLLLKVRLQIPTQSTIVAGLSITYAWLAGSTALMISGDTVLYDRGSVRESDMGITLSEENGVADREPPEVGMVGSGDVKYGTEIVPAFGGEGEIFGEGVL